MTHSFFSSLEAAKPDPILGVFEAFRADPSPLKINLGVGVYQDGDGKIPMLATTVEAARRWMKEEDSKTYLPIEGIAAFNAATQALLFGKQSKALTEKRIATLQTIGGSGALKIAIDFIRCAFPQAPVYISDPSWDNHRLLFEAAGAQVRTYPYYDPATNGLRAEAMLEAMRAMPSGSVVLLHGCCHNPTGVDLSHEEWQSVASICAERSLLPFIDLAYQGFAEGLDQDAYAVRLFEERGLTFMVASSFSKSFSMYRERVGALSIITGSEQEAKIALSQTKRIVRTIYSSPPSYGAQLVSIVLNSPELRPQWEAEMTDMRTRILDMRKLFVQQLAAFVPDRDFSFVLKQRGMFSYSGLSADIIRALKERHHIYALESGRICVAAMNAGNIDYVCNAIADTLKA